MVFALLTDLSITVLKFCFCDTGQVLQVAAAHDVSAAQIGAYSIFNDGHAVLTESGNVIHAWYGRSQVGCAAGASSDHCCVG